MPTAGHLYDNGPAVKPFLLSEAPGERSRSNVTVTVAGTAFASGTVMGKITASGKYVPYKSTNSDGSQTAAGILYARTKAVTGDVSAVLIDTDAEVNVNELTGLDAGATTALKALGIKVRGTDTLGITTPAL